MQTIVLNGGNYGGHQIEAREGVTKVAIIADDGVNWCYDFGLHKKSTTADFVGCDVSEFDPKGEGVMIVTVD